MTFGHIFRPKKWTRTGRWEKIIMTFDHIHPLGNPISRISALGSWGNMTFACVFFKLGGLEASHITLIGNNYDFWPYFPP